MECLQNKGCHNTGSPQPEMNELKKKGCYNNRDPPQAEVDRPVAAASCSDLPLVLTPRNT